MKRRTTAGGRQGLMFHQRRNTDLNLKLIQGEGIPNLHLNPVLQSKGMTNEVNPDPDPDPQAGMTDPDITIDQEVVLTPNHKKGFNLKCSKNGNKPFVEGLCSS